MTLHKICTNAAIFQVAKREREMTKVYENQPSYMVKYYYST